MFPAPLECVRILDLTSNVAGPFCTKLLADFGADVIKIETPFNGDPSRKMGPFHGDDPHPEKSGLFLHLNTNKRSVTLDIGSRTGQGLLRRLAERVNIVVEDFKPGRIAEIGLGYPELQAMNPASVLTSVTNFGQTGPYRGLKGTDLTLYAMGGSMNVTGAAEREPLKVAGHVPGYHAGAVAAYATMLALYQAEDDGEGQHVDVSIYEAHVGSRDRRVILLTAYQYTSDLGRRPSQDESWLATGARECADGYVNVLGAGRWFPAMLGIMGREELLEEPLFSDPELVSQPEANLVFEEYYRPWLAAHGKHEIVRMAQSAGILASPVNTVEDVLNDPSFLERGVFEEVEHPFAGKVAYVGRPFIIGETPRPKAQRAPLLGEHNEEVLCSVLGLSREDLVTLRGQGVI